MSIVAYRAQDGAEQLEPAMTNGRPFYVERALRASGGVLELDDVRHGELVNALDRHYGVERVGEAANDELYLRNAIRVQKITPPRLPVPVVTHTYGLKPGTSFGTLSGATVAYPTLQKMYDVFAALAGVNWLVKARNDNASSIWMLNDVGATAVDFANRRNGSYKGFYQSSQPPILPGSNESSTRFIAPGGYVQIPYDPALNLSQFTYECWVEPDSLDANLQAIAANQLASRGFSWGVSSGEMVATLAGADLSGNAELGLALLGDMELGGDSAAFMSTLQVLSPALTAGALAHCVITYDGVTLKGYVNGVLGGSVSAPDFAPQNTSSAPLLWGSSIEGSGGGGSGILGITTYLPFLGRLAGAATYSYALSGAHVADHYNSSSQIALTVDNTPNGTSDVDGIDKALAQFPILMRIS